MITCEFCSRSFSRNSNMLRHKRTAHADSHESTEEGELSDSTEEKEQTYSDDDNQYSASENEQDPSSDDEEDENEIIVNGVFEEYQPQCEDNVRDFLDIEGMNQEMAQSKAYKDLCSEYGKAMARTFIVKIM